MSSSHWPIYNKLYPDVNIQRASYHLELELSTSTFLEQYIMTPNYPDDYPNNYEEVIPKCFLHYI